MQKTLVLTATLVVAALGNISPASAQYRCGYWTEYPGNSITNVIGPPCGGGNGWQHNQYGRYWGQQPVYGAPPVVIVPRTVIIPGSVQYHCDRNPDDYLGRDEYGNLRCFSGGE